MVKMKNSLRKTIDKWVTDTQESEDPLDMWISDSLVESMANAAWAVLEESRKTQEWMKKEGHTR